MIVRLATSDDDAALTALLESMPMPGSIRLAFGCRPSFFQALRVEGDSPVVCVAEARGQLVAVGAVTFRKVYLNGRVATRRYLSALRVAPQARGSAALAKGFALLRTTLASHPGDLTLTSILADNTPALRVLTGARAALPAYEALGGCVTRVVCTARAAKPNPPTGVQLAHGGDARELAGFLATHGPARNGFPVCLPQDLDGRTDSAFPGLSAADFLVARDGEGILGVMGCWDVRRFRQALVTGYAPWLRWARPWLNFGARCCARPLLPAPGAVLGLAFATLTLVRQGDLRVFRSLLESALAWSRRRGLGHFVMALADHDPLNAGFKGLPQREIHSRIFRVHFEDPSTQTRPDGRTPHFEGAML
ncbi:MAG: hypothetical protein NTW21_26315 [Verrucomicrobia bacterium]|nr:hypothetical protein [Verrucomicrobiota bacterium]